MMFSSVGSIRIPSVVLQGSHPDPRTVGFVERVPQTSGQIPNLREDIHLKRQFEGFRAYRV